MFNADARTLARIARRLERVLVLDPHPAVARLIADLVKEMGGRPTANAATTRRGLELAREIEPQLIFVEWRGEGLDGCEFTAALRRSELAARQAPVIMVTSEATVETIKGARDSGVHEFLRKPFTAGDLYRRVENVLLKPRPWIQAQMYVGPDRRRFNSDDYGGEKKRRVDAGDTSGAFARADAVFRAELAAFDVAPNKALRAMLEQAAELQGALAEVEASDADLAAAVASLQRYLLGALERGTVAAPVIARHMAAILALGQGGEAVDATQRAALMQRLAA